MGGIRRCDHLDDSTFAYVNNNCTFSYLWLTTSETYGLLRLTEYFPILRMFNEQDYLP
jgi:hypothetical protein